MTVYATVVDLKQETGVKSTNAAVVASLLDLLTAASRSIDRICHREDGYFVADTEASYRHYRGDGSIWQDIHHCVSITDVAVKATRLSTTYTAWATPTTNIAEDGDWIAFPGDKLQHHYTKLMVNPHGDHSFWRTSGDLYTVKVNALWGGYVTVPETIEQACIMQATRWYTLLKAQMSRVVTTGEFGKLIFKQPLDPDIATILELGRYIVPAIGGGFP